MGTRIVVPIPSPGHGAWRRLRALAMAIVIALFAPIADASSKAPPLATIVLDAEARAAPDNDAAPVAVIHQGAEVELTGDAAPGFLCVYYDGEAVWVPAQYISLGVRPGIDTGVTVADTPLFDAPIPDASVRAIIQEGQAVILTGASVDGHDAAAHDGAGDWINEKDLSR